MLKYICIKIWNGSPELYSTGWLVEHSGYRDRIKCVGDIEGQWNLFVSEQKKGFGVSYRKYFEKLYAIWCILVMPDIYLKITTWTAAITPANHFCSILITVQFVIISGENWMTDIFWTNSEIFFKFIYWTTIKHNYRLLISMGKK